MKETKLVVLVISMLLAGCGPVPKPTPSSSVIVKDFNGAPVAGAQVFQDGELKGTTDGSGQLFLTPAPSVGAKLFARRLMYTQPSYRPGTSGGWVAHFYQTSVAVNNDGSVTDQTVTNPKNTQTLVLSPSNALIGWHLTASLDWDASDDEFKELKKRFSDASDYLYNLTDGQFFIEEVELADDAQLYMSAEITFKVDSSVWPHSTYNGGFLAAVGGLPHIYMAPFSYSGNSHNERTLIHELGHLAFGLADEYAPFSVTCTLARSSSTVDPAFRALKRAADGTILEGSRSACFMDNQIDSNKLCSVHADSAHNSGAWQPWPCWTTIIGAYSDPGRSDRWIVRTPDMRGAVVGTLPPLPLGLKPKINENNKKYSDLCKPVVVVDSHGASAAGGSVWVRPKTWRTFDYSVGKLGSQGKLEVRGVHLNDTIQSPFETLPFPCTITF